MATLSVGGTTVFDGSATQGLTTATTFPAGMPIKVHSATYTGHAQIATANTFTTVGGTSTGNLSITTGTPASSGSKYLFMAHISHSITNAGCTTFRFYDGSTAIDDALSDASGVIVRGSFGPGHWSTGPSTYPVVVSSMNYLYSPASALSLTLSVKGTMDAASVQYYNRPSSATDASWLSRSICTLTIMEIAG